MNDIPVGSGVSGAVAVATGQIEEVESGATTGNAAAAGAVDAVLVHVQGVEQVRIRTSIGVTGVTGSGRKCRIQIEGRLLQCGRPQFALVLQLGAQ